jgi:hypothetical protein
MDVAEAGLTPEGLPGIPLDGSYSAAVTPPDPALAAAEVPVAVDGSQPGVDPVDAGARDVLNSMADLFQSPEQDQAAMAIAAAKAAKKVEPAKPVRRSLFEILFGAKPKPVKPKSIYGN